MCVDDELFSEIFGHDDVKQLFMYSLKSQKPIHILLQGPPASGKTLFLMALMRFPKAKYYLGGQTSKAGLTEILLTEKPQIVIIDEIDKMMGKDYDALLSLMETGKVVRCKYKLWAEEQLNTKVYAACNVLDGIPPELLSRFLTVEFKPYTREQFIAVARHVLKVREELAENEAETIANLIADYSRDVRDAVKAGRLLKAGAPIELIKKLLTKRNQGQTKLF
jgi:Holliday junction DNA helicase RuvB